ncbi:N-acetylmuramoyl-L-alanine amidase [Corticicoccus populi]|uniref:N-acetylmuramoyl-L-alanine amidase n=1 Tax=Corticicoccus populi TaxID=1812821 RepID=A0ABW5WTB4_9STAP
MFRNEIKLQIFIGDEEIMTYRVALDAGHGRHTAGKRSPAGEREWFFNDKVVRAATAELNTYQNVIVRRLDDPSGQRDIPLAQRTNNANNWNAHVLVSCHHNALAGKWFNGGGVETFIPQGNASNSRNLANLVNPRVVSAMGLTNRGVKVANLWMNNQSKMPSILVEGGFMDSNIDIKALRSDVKLVAQGRAIATGIALYLGLKKKSGNAGKSSNTSSSTKNPTTKKTSDGWNINAHGTQWKKQTGVWVNGNKPITKRRGSPSRKAPSSGQMKAGQRLDYREIARADGHIWLLDLKSNQWIPVKTWNSRTGKVSKDWGTWK